MININPGNSEDFKKACRILAEYTEFIETVRVCQKNSSDIKEALTQAIKTCKNRNVLRSFLQRYEKEIIQMHVLYDYDPEQHMAMERKENYERGRKDGIEIGRKDGIEIGRKDGRNDIIINALKGGHSPEEISGFTMIPLREVLWKSRNNIFRMPFSARRTP